MPTYVGAAILLFLAVFAADQFLGFGLFVMNVLGVATGPWVAGLIGDRVHLTAGLLTGLAVGTLAVMPLLLAARLAKR